MDLIDAPQAGCHCCDPRFESVHKDFNCQLGTVVALSRRGPQLGPITAQTGQTGEAALVVQGLAEVAGVQARLQ